MLTRLTRQFWNHSRTSARASGTDKLSFSILRPARPTQPRCRLTARPSDPLNFAFLSKPIRLGEPRSPDGCRREHSRPDNLIFSSLRSTRLTRPTRRFWNHSRTSARASQPDNRTFPNPKLGEAYPSNTAIAEATVGRRREPPSQTILPFKVPCSARLTRPTRQLLNPLSDVGESLPARQTHPFHLLATTISNPVERYVPGHSGNLSFQSTTGEVQPSDSRVLISCWMPQEPPGWTTSPFPPTSAKLTHQTGGHAHQLDDGLASRPKLYLSVFTCPTQWVLISRRSPVRALPARQPCLF